MVNHSRDYLAIFDKATSHFWRSHTFRFLQFSSCGSFRGKAVIKAELNFRSLLDTRTREKCEENFPRFQLEPENLFLLRCCAPIAQREKKNFSCTRPPPHYESAQKRTEIDFEIFHAFFASPTKSSWFLKKLALRSLSPQEKKKKICSNTNVKLPYSLQRKFSISDGNFFFSSDWNLACVFSSSCGLIC